jgi:adenine-specific DNA-methyltransferase
MAQAPSRRKRSTGPKEAEPYRHPTAEAVLRPEIGTQPQFKKKKPPQTYRYDSSLSPALEWDGGNAARERGEALIRQILEAPDLETAQKAAAELARLSRPFLQWAGKGERLSFDVPTLPLFIHERLSTQAIIETLRGRQPGHQLTMFDLFGDRERPVYEQILSAYEHKNGWINRMILGDSLVVMNSLLHYEGLGGQVQMIYMDPPYGVKFGSNFQPFVRKRDVKHNDDEDMTREPEMVKAYRDTWELGLHSYLTYLRDRLLVARDLLTPSGSIFVQISDENLHHVREVMDEVFGVENAVAIIPFRKKTMPLGAKHLESVTDYILWYARDIERVKFRRLFETMVVEGDAHWNYMESPDGRLQKLTREQINNHRLLPPGAVPVQLVSLYPAGLNATGVFSFTFKGVTYNPPQGNSWFTNPQGMRRLAEADRLIPYEDGKTLRYKLKLSDSPVTAVTNLWSDTSAPSDKAYVVQTSTKVLQRCILMTTDPGDLVLDPTCGSGTSAYMAEYWGRRWITIDTSRVPLAIARQRLLTSVFPFFQLKDASQGPAGGFVYERKQNPRGDETGGLVPYITKGSVASNEPPETIILVDNPEIQSGITRVTGPFCVEATIPAPADWDDEEGAEPIDAYGAFRDRMLEVLRRSPVLHVGGGKVVTLTNVRPPARTLSLAAEALVERDGEEQPVAFAFGPENGAVSETLVFEAAKEAAAKRYTHLYVIGFAIQPHARGLIEHAAEAMGIPATYIQATPDLLMGDLLKTLRSSQIFSVCGLPDIELRKVAPISGSTTPRFEVELKGLDVFDPVTMENESQPGGNVPAWLLDTDYNGLCFRASQVFFPRTAAWDALKRSLKGQFEDNVWEHLAGTVSAPFEAGVHGRIAVKVLDDRGNELMVVKDVTEAR